MLETCHLISCSISRVKLHSSSSSSSSGDIPKVRAPLNLNILLYVGVGGFFYTYEWEELMPT